VPRHFARMLQEDPQAALARHENRLQNKKRTDKAMQEQYVPVPSHVQVIIKTKDERMLRSLVKTLTWNLLDMGVTVSIAYFFTRDIKVALAIGIAQQAWESVLYFFHERLWAKVKKI
jgi:uncharacterized membrane protein